LLLHPIRIAVEIEGYAFLGARERETVARDVNQDGRVTRAKTIDRVGTTRLRQDVAALIRFRRIGTYFAKTATAALLAGIGERIPVPAKVKTNVLG
jgi:hypothetical protein